MFLAAVLCEAGPEGDPGQYTHEQDGREDEEGPQRPQSPAEQEDHVRQTEQQERENRDLHTDRNQTNE